MARSTRRSHRSFVSYIDKSREYYAAHGYEHPYQWAHKAEVPFAKLPRPLSECRVGVVTTSSMFHAEGAGPTGGGGQKGVYLASAEPPPSRMYTDDLSWDKEATHTDDVETFLPLRRLAEQVDSGRIGGLSSRFYGIPTVYSQRRTERTDAPKILDWMREDEVDLALLIPL
jgi:hypothetical protein